MASIQPRRDAAGRLLFRVMFRVDGKQKSAQFADETAAADFCTTVERLGGAAALAIRESRLGREDAAAPPLLKDWFEQHLELATGITDGTRADYRRTAERTWMPALGEVPLDALTRDDVRRWVRWQSTTAATRGVVLSAKSIANAHGLLSSVLSGAVEAGHAPANVARGVALPAGVVEDRVFLTHDEFAQLLTAVDVHWRPLVTFLAATGLRWGEATALRWSEVDLDSPDPAVRVIRAWKRGEKGVRVIGPPKTRRSTRTVTFPADVVDLLHPLRRAPGDLVFVGRQGAVAAHQNFHLRAWTPAVRAFAGDTTAHDGSLVPGPGKRPRIHDLRHTHASWLIAAGVPLPVIQRRLGHESIQTTVDVYGHLDHTAGALASQATAAALAAALRPPS